MDTKIIDKVRKLLALGGSSNEHEARLAMERAAELMLRNNLTMGDIGQELDPATDVISETVHGRLKREERRIDGTLQEFFFIRVVRARTRGRREVTVHFIGKRQDVEVALYVRQYLSRTFRTLCRAYERENPEASAASYYSGLIWGVERQLAAMRTKVVTETALVIVNDPRIDAKLDEMFPSRKRGRSLQLKDAASIARGITDGEKIQIHRGVSGDGKNQKQLS